MKITELSIVKSAMTAFGFSADITETAAKKEIKQKIENGEIKFEALTDKQAEDMIKYLIELKEQAANSMHNISVEEMIENKKELSKVATIFDQIAISNYNYATAELSADKSRFKTVVSAVTDLSEIYDAKIEEKEKQEQAERLQFARDWFAEEIVKYDIYDFAADWNLYKGANLEIKGAYNYTKRGQLSSLKKDRKDYITNKLNQYQTDKQVIENNEHGATLLEFYIKANHDLPTALSQLEEFKRLKLEEEERAKAKAEAEQAERERIQAQIKAEEEAKAEAERAKLQELDTDIVEAAGDLDSLWVDDSDLDLVTESVQLPETGTNEQTTKERITELEGLIFFEEMADRADHAKINEWRQEIAQLKVNEIERKEHAKVQEVDNDPKHATLTLRTFDAPATKLGNLLNSTGVDVQDVYVHYDVTIEVSRLDGFKKWLTENNIEIVED